jgi:Mg2+ and Co2+ transporter CorA
MNERQEHTADVLGKLTVLGTIVLPMNIICGMWGMNVKVPGQEVDSLTWFWCSMSSLFSFTFSLLPRFMAKYHSSYRRTPRICSCLGLDC